MFLEVSVEMRIESGNPFKSYFLYPHFLIKWVLMTYYAHALSWALEL